jgi:DNA-binding NarL/FixJ family response regulator
VVYDQAAMAEFPFRYVREAIGLGEEARLAGRLGLRMFLVDDRLGMVPMKAGQSLFDGMLVIHRSAVLDALSELFELIWQRAVPLNVGSEAEDAHLADTDDTALLGLLAAGLGDAAVARQLRLSLRTVERRISRIMVRLNAKTRFQAGVILGRDDYYHDHDWTHRVALPRGT